MASPLIPSPGLSRSTDAPASGASGSTFYWPMLLLPRSKRAAMFGIYAYCRRLDDIADEPGDPAVKRRELDQWRRDIHGLYVGDAPTSPILAALKGAIDRYGLPRAEFDALIDGMAMDLPAPAGGGGMRAPPLCTLRLYCRRVAGAVGHLAIRVFDRADSDTEIFATSLGEALQLTNILRDLDEDAAMGRLYLPREMLDAAGIAESDPAAVLAHPRLEAACTALAKRAEGCFGAAQRALERCPRRGRLWAALAMMILYRRLLARLVERGWAGNRRCVRIGKREAAWVTIRCTLGHPPAR